MLPINLDLPNYEPSLAWLLVSTTIGVRNAVQSFNEWMVEKVCLSFSLFSFFFLFCLSFYIKFVPTSNTDFSDQRDLIDNT